MKRIAIITPARNEEEILPGFVKSIRKQTLKVDMIIIADGDSSDKTKEIARKLGCKVVKGGYPDEGRNAGAKYAASKGIDLFAFVDCDVLIPNKRYIEKAVKEFEERGLDVAGTLQKHIKLNKYFRDNIVYPTIYGIANKAMLFAQNSRSPFMQCFMFATKKAHLNIGGFKPIDFGEDSKYACDAVSNGLKFGVISGPGHVLTSVRRFEKKGVYRLVLKDLWFNIRRTLGHEYYRSEKSVYHRV